MVEKVSECLLWCGRDFTKRLFLGIGTLRWSFKTRSGSRWTDSFEYRLRRAGEKPRMSTLVTGATGFLGRHLIDVLIANGEEVRALVRRQTDPGDLAKLPVQIVRGDLSEPDTLAAAMHGIEKVYHTAAKVDIAATTDLGMSQLNSGGTRNVLEAAWRAGVDRVVYTSSVGAIGAGDPRHLLNEDDVYRGRGTNLPYTRSKVLADRVAMQFVRRGLPLVPVYPTLFMGPADRYLRTSNVIVTFLQGRALGYIAGGFGCTDVRDVAAGHAMAMQRGQIGRRYILGGWNISLYQFYRKLAEITGIHAPTLRLPAFLAHGAATLTKWAEPYRGKAPVITHGDVDNARYYWYYDYSRVREELGLHCRPLVETLRDTVAWLRAEKLSAGRIPAESRLDAHGAHDPGSAPHIELRPREGSSIRV
jgi:dihydroflavonol-4-reductase